ncbi:Protein M03D4.4 b [Aphelenchoides avenae]|nr:Protein M03D4.4 b [Aphelenchus avenae]
MFGDRDQLNVHYTHTHRDKPQYVCELCNAVFSVKRELSTHMRLHSGEQPHKCPDCGKEFGTRQLLKKHLMWHTGERSHVCAVCSKAFYQKGHLTQHMQIHSGERPHRCHLCKKTFIFTFDLNRHMKIHLERRFSCDACQKSFSEQRQLDEHSNRCKGTPDRKRSAPSRDSDSHSLSSDESHHSTDGSGTKMARLSAPKEQGISGMHNPAQGFSAFRQQMSSGLSSSAAQAPQFAEHPADSSKLMLAGAQRLMANAALQNIGALANDSSLMANISAMAAQLHATRLLAAVKFLNS